MVQWTKLLQWLAILILFFHINWMALRLQRWATGE